MEKRAIYIIRLFTFFTFLVISSLWQSRRGKSVFAYASTLSFFFLITAATVPSVRESIIQIISPLPHVQKSLAAVGKEHKLFAFVPGWTLGKFDNISLSGLSAVAYFDLPIQEDGSLYKDVPGYELLQSEESLYFREKAHVNNTKVLLTLTQTYNPDIITLITNKRVQKTLVEEAVAEVKANSADGVVIDIEYSGSNGEQFNADFAEFLSYFTKEFHNSVSGGYVAVVLPDNATGQPFYDISQISQLVDSVFVMAYEYAVPELASDALSAPTYGYDKDEYAKKVATTVKRFQDEVPAEKLVLETAWYGDGNQYPFYQSGAGEEQASTASESFNSLKTPLSEETITSLTAEVPRAARAAARKNLPIIAKALEKEGILTPNVLSYALATIEHETAGTFTPIEEFKGRKNARRLGYEGGTAYFGRGFIQLTHLRNYKRVGRRIGLGDKLVESPELALRPEISAQILASFFKDNGIARLAHHGDFISARAPINPDMQAWSIAELAYKYLYSFV